MRILKTLVLRLLIDSETPHVLRGAVRAISDNEEYTFTDGQTLLALLYEISQAALRKADQSSVEGTRLGVPDEGPAWGEGGECKGEA